jgi:hypothetical protein
MELRFILIGVSLDKPSKLFVNFVVELPNLGLSATLKHNAR